MVGLRLGVAWHPSNDVGDSLDVLLGWCAEREAGAVVRAGAAGAGRAGVQPVGDDEFAATVDAVVSLGGDGTLLGAMRGLVHRPVPVLGVNRGNVGFLVEVQPEELAGALDRLARGEYEVESHPCLQVRVLPGPGRTAPATAAVAFNDVALARRGGGTPVDATLLVGGDEYGYYRCDALVVATPVGSTAYSYAAGGPVLSPSSSTTVVTPVAPMAGLERAIVLGGDDEVDLVLQAPSSGVEVEVDGAAVATVEESDTVQVRVRRDAGRVVRLDALHHARASMVKLALLGLPLRSDRLTEAVPGAAGRSGGTLAPGGSHQVRGRTRRWETDPGPEPTKG